MSSITGRTLQRLLQKNTRHHGQYVNHHDKLLTKKLHKLKKRLNLERRTRFDQTTRTHAII